MIERSRLLGCAYASGAVSRLGGDDFVILLSEISKPAMLELKPVRY
jgi:GGDEF domain-containing protein